MGFEWVTECKACTGQSEKQVQSSYILKTGIFQSWFGSLGSQPTSKVGCETR